MPELPEVETTCQKIKPCIDGRDIKKIIVRESRLRWPIPHSLTKLRSVSILSLTRRAKYLLLTTASGTIIIHLGMSGRLSILEENLQNKQHDHVDFVLDNNLLIRYTDPRRFGAILWTTQDPLEHPLLANLGPEPFDKTFNAKYLFHKTQGSRLTIKQFIMDAKMVVGVGNIYANEALFVAKILPHRKAHTLTVTECKNLTRAIQTVLKKAIQKEGTTLRDFLTPHGKPGVFAQNLLVYGRENTPCVCCKQPLSSSRIGQRATVFCVSCQR